MPSMDSMHRERSSVVSLSTEEIDALDKLATEGIAVCTFYC